MGGRTGWPLVDACVAMLRATGWLNFRMRAMLVSVAAYPAWLHWREVGLWLARAFLDYEPGIHWSQLQMQSGTTGINTTRVYNPIKQARDHDPQGVFVRRWLPALRRVPDTWLFEPWRMPESVQARCGARRRGHRVAGGRSETATRAAKTRIHAPRAQPEVREGGHRRAPWLKPPQGGARRWRGRRRDSWTWGFEGQGDADAAQGDLPTKPCAGVGGRSRGGRSGSACGTRCAFARSAAGGAWQAGR